MERKIDRFDKYMKLKGLNDNKVTIDLGLSIGTLGKSRKEGRDLSDRNIEKILNFYTDIEKIWLLTGEDNMLKSRQEFKSNVRIVPNAKYTDVVYVPIHAQAGYGKGYGDIAYIESLPTMQVIIDKNYNGNYRVFEVDVDSMDNGSRDAICDGDKILCREVRQDLWLSKLHINSWFFVIVMKNDGILIKQIIDHNVEQGIITCHSLNPLFNNFEIDLRDVAELYNAIKIIERNIRL